MKNEDRRLDELLFKINTLEDSLKILKNQLNRVYNMCDTYFTDEVATEREPENDRRD